MFLAVYSPPAITDGNHGLYRTRGSVCASLFDVLEPPAIKVKRPLAQVGPVLDKFELGGVPYESQYISAGFSGHGMPRAFGWSVYSFLFLYPDDQASQRGHRGSHDCVRDHGPRVGATTMAPTPLSYEPTKSLRELTRSIMAPCKWYSMEVPNHALSRFQFIESYHPHLLIKIYTNQLYPRRRISWGICFLA